MKRNLSICLTGLALAVANVVQSATLPTVPMQGSMVHVGFAYDSLQSRLTVNIDPVVPQLTPLDVSNPNDAFAPGDPWFVCLDPSRQSLAFNRQYGFVMDASTDPLPAGTSIWIRMLSHTPNLAAYRYRSTDPKAWEPMFGNGGSTNLLQWNLAMFHPAMAAPPGTGTGTRSASFQAFLVNTNNGQAVSGITPVDFTLHWTVVPSARPPVSIGNCVVIAWPLNATNYVLQCADSLSASNWVTVTNTPVPLNGQSAVILDRVAGHQFFRLTRVP